MILFHYQDILFLNLYILLECLFYQYHKNGSLIGSRQDTLGYIYGNSNIGACHLSSSSSSKYVYRFYIDNSTTQVASQGALYKVWGFSVRSFEL